MPLKKVNSVPEIFQNRVKEIGEKPCVSYKEGGVYKDLTFAEMDVMIRNTACFLLSSGIKKGEKVAIFSENRYEWWVADQAILSIGAINVPIYSTNSADEARYVLHHSDSRICFVSTSEHLEKVQSVNKKVPKLKLIISIEELKKKSKNVIQLSDAMDKGAKYKNKSMFDKRLKAINPKDQATIIYTSGTTGDPKGVMLSHGNFIANIRQVFADFEEYFNDEEIFLSFLPLSHSLERTSGYYVAVSIGAKVAFVEDFSTIQENLVEVRPTVLVSVPRLYEKIHAGILAKVSDAPAIKKLLFNLAVKTAEKNLPNVCADQEPTGLFAKRYNFFDKVIFSKLKLALGMDRLKFAVSGGAPLSVSDANFFLGMGVLILEGYGLSETSPITNANRIGEIKPGSVGRPVIETKIKLSDVGEIMIKGPQVMMGYYKNPKATKEVMTKDGYFKTGDIGQFDEMGRLSITGRIKDIIVTAGGKNISPQNIENSLKNSLYIEQAAIIGDRRKYLSALVVPSFEALHKWARDNNVSFVDNKELLTNEAVLELYDAEIKDMTTKFARVEQIRKFTLVDNEWTQETGELTPTLKVKRMVIEEKYGKVIDDMYPS